MTTELRWGAATDVGLVRSENQDNFTADFPLFIVADGMGGHTGGEVASQIAVDTIREQFKTNATAAGLREAVAKANEAIFARGEQEPRLQGMGTTVTGLALVVDEETNDEVLCVINVGDSRTYTLRLGELEQISEDHSVPEEMVRLGLLSPDDVDTHEKRHMVTRALGVIDDLDVDTWLMTPYKGERYLICSDGLVREVSHGQIASVLRRVAEAQDAARELVTMAVARGGSDNITVIVVDVIDDGGRIPVGEAAEAAAPVRTYGSDEVDQSLVAALEAEAALEQSTPVGETPSEPLTAEDLPEGTHLGKRTRAASPLLTWRVMLMVLGVFVVLLAAFFGLRWYAESGAQLRVQEVNGQQHIVIYKGRDEGVLWWHPTLVEDTGISIDKLRTEDRDQIIRTKDVPGVAEARQLLSNLVAAGATQRGTQTP